MSVRTDMSISKNKKDNSFRVFFHGFHYGFLNAHRIDEKYIDYSKNNSHSTPNYTKGIKAGKFYHTYRYEFLAFTFIFGGIFILTVW